MYGEMRESVIQVQIWIMTISYMVKYDLVLEIQIWVMNLHKLNMYYYEWGPNDNMSAQTQVMAWHRSGGKPLNVPMLTKSFDAMWHYQTTMRYIPSKHGRTKKAISDLLLGKYRLGPNNSNWFYLRFNNFHLEHCCSISERLHKNTYTCQILATN